MEEDIKTLVSDEIKKFRKSYQVGMVMGVTMFSAMHNTVQ